MNETGNVFDASSSLMGSEEIPAHNDPFYEEGPPPELKVGEEPDYFIVEAPSKKRVPRLPRRRAIAALGLVGGLVVMVALVGAATGSDESRPSSPPPTASTTQAQVEDLGPAVIDSRMDRIVNVNAKRAQQAKLNAEAVTRARKEEKAKAGRKHDRKEAKPSRPRHAHDSHPAPAPSPDPEPVSEPETSYYVPTEVAPPPPSPTPVPSPAGGATQEFGIEP